MTVVSICAADFAAAGVHGVVPGLKSAKMLMKYLFGGSEPKEGGVSRDASSIIAARNSGNGDASGIQIPERSGLPSRPRGAGAVRFALPSFVRGVPGAG